MRGPRSEHACEHTEKMTLGLPREVRSLCPECHEVIPGSLYEEDNQVFMAKSCPDHGEVLDLIASRADLFLRNERLACDDSVQIENPVTQDPDLCPSGCGLCPGHLSTASMSNLDLTNRCNLRCPFCFANANVQPYVYEPDLKQIEAMLDRALSTEPRRMQAIQFSGGEPTLSPHILDACRMAKDRGIRLIQVATNGIRFAREPGFAEAAAEAGLNGAYLQFDGIGDEVYEKTRGVKGLWETKLKALESCRKNGIRVTLVPTIVKGINDDQVGEILKFAVKNMETIVGVSFQPVAFTGRIDQEKRLAQRYTLTHLCTDIEEQTGFLRADQDWLPFTITAPFAQFIDNIRGSDENGYAAMHCNTHPDCGLAAYLLVNERTGETVPLSQVVDVTDTVRGMLDLAEKTRNNPSKLYASAKLFNLIMKIYRPENTPKSLGMVQLAKTVDAISGHRLLGVSKERRYEWRMLLVASMHFQDAYNFQVDRVQRCVIHYSAPDGKLYPFCTYNTGPGFRESVEREYSVPKEEWVKNRGGRYVTDGFEE